MVALWIVLSLILYSALYILLGHYSVIFIHTFKHTHTLLSNGLILSHIYLFFHKWIPTRKRLVQQRSKPLGHKQYVTHSKKVRNKIRIQAKKMKGKMNGMMDLFLDSNWYVRAKMYAVCERVSFNFIIIQWLWDVKFGSEKKTKNFQLFFNINTIYTNFCHPNKTKNFICIPKNLYWENVVNKNVFFAIFSDFSPTLRIFVNCDAQNTCVFRFFW